MRGLLLPAVESSCLLSRPESRVLPSLPAATEAIPGLPADSSGFETYTHRLGGRFLQCHRAPGERANSAGDEYHNLGLRRYFSRTDHRGVRAGDASRCDFKMP